MGGAVAAGPPASAPLLPGPSTPARENRGKMGNAEDLGAGFSCRECRY